MRLPVPCPPSLDQGIDFASLKKKSWWGKTKESLKSWTSLGEYSLAKGIKSINTETLRQIKDTSVNAICGLREISCTHAYSGIYSNTEKYEPDYVKMEDSVNKENKI